jgi:hypothetical protein
MFAGAVEKITSVSQAEGVAALAIDAIEAAAWLLDQLAVGELYDLEKTSKPPCWISVVAQSGSELATTLRQIAVETIAGKTQELRAAVRVLNPAAVHGQPAPPRARTARRKAA